jgi:methylmalonyl-CoA/ethylmalonyl-CoA epimerase
MIKVKRIDHIAIAAGDCETSTRDLAELFGLPVTCREFVPAQMVDVAFLGAAPAIEVISPAAAPEGAGSHGDPGGHGNPGLSRFLERRGPGLHHICFEVEDLPAALAALKQDGIRLIDEVPRQGARGHLVAFIHPASTGGVLFELCASPHGA